MTRTHCPCCHQPLPPLSREGVYLPPTKAEIFDFIDKHPGVTGEGIAWHCSIPINTVRQHVHQINSLLAATCVQVSGNEPGERGFYRIVRRRIGEVA